MKKNIACVINYGCQMNEYESQTVGKMLLGAGYDLTENPDEAEVVILNTCTIRDNADMKVWHKLEHLLPQKRRSRNRKKIGIMGCMVAAQKENFLKKHPEIDFLITPSELSTIGTVLQQVTAKKFSDYSSYEYIVEGNSYEFRSFLPVQTGCNFNCTYCIVPAVKGREINLAPSEILEKASELAFQGVQEITLLGQTINSWRYEQLRFADLLKMVATALPQVWIRFLTSHPLLFDEKILEVMKSHQNLCPWIHIPAQSGSSRVLKAMKRGYTRESYLDLIHKMRQTVPGVCLSTDMIAGFPQETEEDFQQTLSLLQEVRYETAYLFHYSERQNTVAASMDGAIPMEIRKERLKRMIEVQREIQSQTYQNFLGKQELILIEAESRRGEGQYKGRTSGNLPVLLSAPDLRPGSFVQAKIVSATSHSLFGEVV